MRLSTKQVTIITQFAPTADHEGVALSGRTLMEVVG